MVTRRLGNRSGSLLSETPFRLINGFVNSLLQHPACRNRPPRNGSEGSISPGGWIGHSPGDAQAQRRRPQDHAAGWRKSSAMVARHTRKLAAKKAVRFL